jgi:hypothetical protein
MEVIFASFAFDNESAKCYLLTTEVSRDAKKFICFVTGHDFSRAEQATKGDGL